MRPDHTTCPSTRLRKLEIAGFNILTKAEVFVSNFFIQMSDSTSALITNHFGADRFASAFAASRKDHVVIVVAHHTHDVLSNLDAANAVTIVIIEPERPDLIRIMNENIKDVSDYVIPIYISRTDQFMWMLLGMCQFLKGLKRIFLLNSQMWEHDTSGMRYRKGDKNNCDMTDYNGRSVADWLKREYKVLVLSTFAQYRDIVGSERVQEEEECTV